MRALETLSQAGSLARLLAAVLAAAGCRAPVEAPSPARPEPIDAEVPVEVEVPDDKSLHFSRLQPFAPDTLLEFRGQPMTASTARFGEVAVTEVERIYSEGVRTAKLRIVDTSLSRAGRPAFGPAFEDEHRLRRPMRTAGAKGTVDFDKESQQAVANLVVADRILITVTCENARGPEDAERLAAALDLSGLDVLVQKLR